jgi:hypothetical protein
MDKDKGTCSATPAACGTDKKKCCGKMIMAAIVGGIVMFAWMGISWMALPWHKAQFNAFKDEAAVSKAVGKNAQASGVYIMPHTNMGKDKAKTEKPFAFVVVKAEGVGDMKAAMNRSLIGDFILSVVLAGMLGCLLKMTAGSGCPVLLSVKVGLIAGLVAHVPNNVWFHFPTGYTVLGVADAVVAFALAGLVIAKFVLKLPLGKAACGMGACGTKT